MELLQRVPAILLFLTPLFLTAWPDRKPAPPPRPEEKPVARITLPCTGLEIRPAGEQAFRPWTPDAPDLLRGTTLRIGAGETVSLNFVQNVQIQLGRSVKSKLILEGPVDTPEGRVLLLGLEQGDLWIQSYADEPVVLEMPHARVQGRQCYFTVEARRGEEGEYTARVKALSRNITVSNDFGSITLTDFREVRVDEEGPPTVLGPMGRVR